MGTADLLDTLRALELELQSPKTRGSEARLNELLHGQFREIARSGAVYSRDDIIQVLLRDTAASEIRLQDFALEVIAEGCVLLTYRSAGVGSSGVVAAHAWRSSLWVFESGRWQLVFHQGTPTEAFDLK